MNQVKKYGARTAWIAVAFCVASISTASAGGTKAAAGKAAADGKINVQQLAVADRALAFCEQIDPESAKQLKEQIAKLTKGATADAVAEARSSDGYKDAYSSMDGFVGQIDPRNAKVACANNAHHK